jgi:hypothetical protein
MRNQWRTGPDYTLYKYVMRIHTNRGRLWGREIGKVHVEDVARSGEMTTR